jgi:hypothetical protein
MLSMRLAEYCHGGVGDSLEQCNHRNEHKEWKLNIRGQIRHVERRKESEYAKPVRA